MSEADLARLLDLLVTRFDEVVGPVVADGTIRLRPITSIADLPTGVTDEQEVGHYRLHRSGGRAHFSYGVGPDSPKAIVHPPRTPVWTMRRRDGTLVTELAAPPTVTRALVGVKACDLRGMAVLARTQTGGPYVDPWDAAAQEQLFTVTVDCTTPAPTCLCGAGSGPAALDGVDEFDVALTELEDAFGVRYVARCGSDRGQAVLEELGLHTAHPSVVREADQALRRAEQSLIREMPADAAEVVRRADHPRWDEVAERCLACGNCTAVCPTCFCTDVEDRIELDGETSVRTRVWDTCFSREYSHLGSGPHRSSTRSRYRQWLTHKLGTWHDQFGESGCVGCGRCITWCPVGIDLTAEVEALGFDHDREVIAPEVVA